MSDQSTRLGAGVLGVQALLLVETFGRPWPRPEDPPEPKRKNPKRAAQAAQRKARAINQRGRKR